MPKGKIVVLFGLIGHCIAIGLILPSGGGIAQTRARLKEQRVPNKLTLNHIIGSQQDTAQHRLIVTTDRSGRLWLDTARVDSYSKEKISAAEATKSIIVLEFDAQDSQIKSAFMPIVDPIVHLSPTDDDKDVVRVTAMKRPTFLLLRKDNPEFQRLYKTLQEAHSRHREGLEAALAVPRGSDAIADVLLVTPSRQR